MVSVARPRNYGKPRANSRPYAGGFALMTARAIGSRLAK